MLRRYGVHYNIKWTTKVIKKWIYVETYQKDPCGSVFCGRVFICKKGISVTHESTHTPSQTEYQVTKFKDDIKRRAEEIEETTRQILATEFRNISDGVVANLSSLGTFHRIACNSCQDRNIPATPAHRENIPDLPQVYRTTTNRDPFLVYDRSARDEQRIIFISQDALQFLAYSKQWYADGMFKASRNFFPIAYFTWSV